MATNLRGVMAALLTPFDQQQALDKASLRRLVQFNIQQGIDGLYVGGSTGEAFVQSLSEREQVLEIVAEEAKGKIKLIAHVGCVSTAESQQLAASAKRYGFDAVSAVTPFYYPFSFEEHCDHYRAIIDSADGLPMVVYNIPALSGVKLTLDQINTLVTVPYNFHTKACGHRPPRETHNEYYNPEYPVVSPSQPCTMARIFRCLVGISA